MDRSKEYRYLKSKTDHFKSFANTRKTYLEPILKMYNPKKILELGCGEGSLGLVIKNLTGAQVFGIDSSATGIRLAKAKVDSLVFL